MQSRKDVDDITNTLAEVWGKDVVGTDRAGNKVYIDFVGDIVTSMVIDCDLGVSHCLVDLPGTSRPSLVPKTLEDLCVYANRLNITLARVLGVSQYFQVLDDTLKLSDTRTFEGQGDIVEVCETQARDSMSLMRVMTQSLSKFCDEPEESDSDVEEAERLLC